MLARLEGSTSAGLPGGLRGELEQALGTGLADVRIHTSGAAADAASALDAQAFAVGNDVYFGAGRFDPDSSAGRSLIAHEVAHTVQQRGATGGVQTKLDVSSPGDQHEEEADRFAASFVAGGSAPVSPVAAGSVSRKVIARQVAGAPAIAAPAAPAPAAPASASTESDRAALDEAFETAAHAQNALISRRQVGVREVLGNLNEADAPSLTDDLLKSLAVAALGFGSGYITAMIAARLVAAAAQALNNAVQTALDDGLKDATTGIATRITTGGGGGASKATFFASQEEALEVMRQRALDGISAQKRAARTAVDTAADPHAAAAEQIRGAQDFKRVTNASADLGRQGQYRHSLAQWMNAMARGRLGVDPRAAAGPTGGGTDLTSPASTGWFPTLHAAGVVYVYCGVQPVDAPFVVRDEIVVRGVTDNVRNNPAIRSTPLRALGVPIVVRAGMVASPRGAPLEVSFGRNETGAVWVEGSMRAPAQALALLQRAGCAVSPVAAAQMILDRDIGGMTLGTAS